MRTEKEDVAYEVAELDELVHVYGVTIHRSQGREYRCVAIPLTISAWMTSRRNLLYTATVIRAKRLVVLVGSRKALGQAVRAVGSGRQHAALDYRLCSS